MNLNLFGHDHQWLMVDCGLTFKAPLSETDPTLHDRVCADPQFIAQQINRLAGIVITHAHEDHLGALPYLWRRFKCPVYTTRFTAEILRRKLAETGLAGKVPIIEVNPQTPQQIGVFSVEWKAITHSIPEPYGLLIKTQAGRIFHTADWKIDAQPVTGKAFAPQIFEELGQQDITAMVCDSTNALREGHSASEAECAEGLLKVVEQAKGRVVVGCFSSNIARLISLARIAQQTGRYMAVLGRSLQNMVSAAKVTGHWPKDLILIDSSHLGYLPKEEVLAVATGSQGEPRAILSRLASGHHPDLLLEPDDTVIFSSIIIPGNELLIERLVKEFKHRGIKILQAESAEYCIHASGHPCQDELKALYSWVKPKISIPVHGEPEHIKKHAQLAKSYGVPIQLAGLNGDLYLIAPQPGIRRQVVATGRIALDA
ncbi:ribonuclease J [Nitrincola nitratireducens]|uniref:Ribonuclease J 1 n=1 Tax=Nitrincola nitratireducens TaxID=1229521 RepID=W9UTZ0_9GAMM|nr:ribonuclease J [Nitrincola nitratireducens]EXJ10564.1 Ribonuclease J 1 [Nitrincola nitratireducens]